jgi:acetylornithine deacetylase/succinyl-diaminopimelate desuccinylase-like protein
VELVGSGDVAGMLWARPSVSVLGVDAPSVAEAANVLQPAARAKIGLRIPPGEDRERAMRLLTDHLRAVAPWGCRVAITPREGGDPWRAETGGPAHAAALRALTAAFGREAGEIGAGGSIPLVAALSEAVPGAEIILWGPEDLAGSRIHGADESVDPAELERMVVAEALLLADLGASS